MMPGFVRLSAVGGRMSLLTTKVEQRNGTMRLASFA